MNHLVLVPRFHIDEHNNLVPGWGNFFTPSSVVRYSTRKQVYLYDTFITHRVFAVADRHRGSHALHG